MIQKIPGILLIIAVSLLATALLSFLPSLGIALLALILGLVIRQLPINFQPFNAGIAWIEKYVLETAIVFIGFGIQVDKIEELGSTTLLVVVGSVVLVALLSMLLQQFLGKGGKLFWLLGAGSAICGSAAIGATAPLIKPKDEETGVAMAVINVLGICGMLGLPILAGLLHFVPTQTGIMLGGILQSMGHVVGGAFVMGDEIGQIATVVKLGRVAFLIPFLIIVYFVFRKQSDGVKLKFPLFIILFVASVLVAQSGILADDQLKHLSKSGDVLLNVAMAAIGAKINLKALWKISGKGLLAGSIIFAAQILYFVLMIVYVL